MKFEVVMERRTLTYIGKKYGLTFDKKFFYYTGDAYVNNKNEPLPTVFDGIYQLKYFDGCFNPFLIRIMED